MDINLKKIGATLLAGAASVALLGSPALAQQAPTGPTGPEGQPTGDPSLSSPPGSLPGEDRWSARPPGAGTHGDRAAADARPAPEMTEQQIGDAIGQRGITDMQPLQRADRDWTTRGTRDGAQRDVVVQQADGLRGAQLDEESLSDMIARAGYSDVSDVRQEGDIWTAEAMEDGEPVTLHILSESGIVIVEREDRG